MSITKTRWFSLSTVAVGIVLPVLCVAIPALAQESRGTISGTITDSSKAVVAGAHVTATEVLTRSISRATSNETGLYSVSFLPPGEYEISVDSPGFKKAIRKSITLASGQRLGVDVELETGVTSESITVTASVPLVNTVDASIGQVITTEEVSHLPLNGRTPLQLALLAAGVLPTIQPGQLLPFANGTAAALSVAGSPANSAEILLDGAPDNIWTGVAAYSPPQDAVQQLTVRVFDADASYGHTQAGVINQVMKNGTNALHGSLYEYAQISALGANSYFNNRAGVPISVSHFNQYGLTSGGPVYIPKVVNGKDKLFFFFGWEGLHQNKPSTSYSTVPTDAERKGDFSALLPLGCPSGYQGGNSAVCADGTPNPYQLYNPYSATRSGTVISRQPIPNNNLAGAGLSLNPIAVNYLKFFPQPNTTGAANGYQNYISNPPVLSEFDNEIARLDYNLGASSHMFANFRHNNATQTSSNTFQNIATGGVLGRTNRGASLDEIYILSPSSALEVRGNWTEYGSPQGGNSAGYDPSQIGFPAYMSQASVHRQLPTIAMSGTGFGTLGNATIFGSNSTQVSDLYQLFTDVVKTVGRHSLKFGVDLRRQVNDLANYGNSAGSFSFGSNWMMRTSTSAAPVFGSDLASFLLGLPTSGSFDINVTPAYHSYYLAGFVQDNWQVSSRLVLNLGLRYDRDMPYIEKYGRVVSGFDTTTNSPIAAAAIAAYAAHPIALLPASAFQVRGGLTYPSRSDGRAYQIDSGFLSPRIGFAFRPFSGGKETVIRGGFATFVGPVSGQSSSNTMGFSATTQYVSTNDSYLTPAATLSDPFTSGITQPPGSSQGLSTFLGQSVSYFHSPQLNPYSIRWNIGIQHAITPNLLVEADYIGNHGVHQPVTTSRNALPDSYLSTLPWRDQSVINALSAVVTNPFQGLLPGTSLNGATTTAASVLAPYPQFSAVNEQLNPIGQTYYDALQTRIEKRFSHGIYLQASYGWSKSLASTSYLNSGDANPAKMLSTVDSPHHFVGIVTYHLPVGAHAALDFKSKWANSIFGGWIVNAMFTRQSGFPITWSTDMVTTGQAITVDARQTSPGVSAISKGAFDLVAADQFSYHLRSFPLQIAGLRVDGINNMDASILKEFHAWESVRLQLRLETFNSLNHPVFGSPNTSPTSASFGIISSQANTPRQTQIAAKIIF